MKVRANGIGVTILLMALAVEAGLACEALGGRILECVAEFERVAVVPAALSRSVAP